MNKDFIRLLIADDHQALLDGFTSIMDQEADIQVVATAHDGRQVLEILSEITVDVILLDINMPVMNGVEVCKKLTKQFPDVRVIALSMYDQQSYFKRMIQHGAMGYLLKNDSAEEIKVAIRTVYDGNKFISSKLRDKMYTFDFLNAKSSTTIDVSPREQEVLQFISQGLTDPEMGEKLFISYHTVNSHRKNLLSKFNARNSAELVKKALEMGLI